MDIAAILKAVISPYESQPDRGLQELQPGELLTGRVLRLETDGRLLMDLGSFRALAQTDLRVQPGQTLRLQVIQAGNPLHLRVDQDAQAAGRPQPPQMAFTQMLDAPGQQRLLQTLDKLILQSGAQDAAVRMPMHVSQALSHVRSLFDALPLASAPQRVPMVLQNVVEDSGLFLESRIANAILTGASVSGPSGQGGAQGPQSVQSLPVSASSVPSPLPTNSLLQTHPAPFPDSVTQIHQPSGVEPTQTSNLQPGGTVQGLLQELPPDSAKITGLREPGGVPFGKNPHAHVDQSAGPPSAIVGEEGNPTSANPVSPSSAESIMRQPVEKHLLQARVVLPDEGLSLHTQPGTSLQEANEGSGQTFLQAVHENSRLANLFARDSKAQLLIVKQFLQEAVSANRTELIPPKDADFLRHQIERLVQHVEQQQDRAVQRADNSMPFQVFAYSIGIEENHRPIQIKVYYPRKEGAQEPLHHRVALLLDMDRLGMLRVDLALQASHLLIDFFVPDEKVRNAVEQRKHLVSEALADRFNQVLINVRVSREKIAGFEREDLTGASPGKIDIQA